MSKKRLKATGTILVPIVFAALLIWSLQKKGQVSQDRSLQDRDTSFSSTLKNKAVILKSFQTEGSVPTEDLMLRKVASQKDEEDKEKSRTRLTSKRRSQTHKNTSTAATNTLYLNNVQYVWMNSLSAKKLDLDDDSRESSSPYGYQISTLPSPQKEFGVFEESALFVVTDRHGFERKIITGAFIVKFHDISLVESVAQSLNLDQKYSAPQINTFIFQAKNGQNLFHIESSLRASPGVESVILEVLGRGATSK